MPGEPAVLDVRGAAKRLTLPTGTTLDVLRSVDLTVAPRETVAVMGRSGSGKSTLLRALGLFTRFDSGSHVLLGRDMATAGDRECSGLRARRIGFVFQDFRLLPRLTALANVEYGCLLAGIPRRQRRAVAGDALAAVGLAERMSSHPAQLSGGEQQRVAVARALVKEPALILADEPTGALDVETADAVISMLVATTTDYGASLIVVTHDSGVAASMHRRLVLESGTLRTLVPAAAER